MKLIIQLIVCIFLIASTYADILTIANIGNTPIPLNENDISMEEENVAIFPGTGINVYYDVDCLFKMISNSSEAKIVTMAFPISSPLHESAFRQFKVSIGNSADTLEVIPTKITMTKDHLNMSWAEKFYWERPHDSMDYPGYVQWQVPFKPIETKFIKCSYHMGAFQRFWAKPVEGWFIEYIVRTGALWKGNIKKATINIKFESDPRINYTEENDPFPFETILSYKDNAKWVSTKELQWTFTNWKPDKDIRFISARWIGYDESDVYENDIRLPYPYHGNDTEYTE